MEEELEFPPENPWQENTQQRNIKTPDGEDSQQQNDKVKRLSHDIMTDRKIPVDALFIYSVPWLIPGRRSGHVNDECDNRYVICWWIDYFIDFLSKFPCYTTDSINNILVYFM